MSTDPIQRAATSTQLEVRRRIERHVMYGENKSHENT